LYAELNYHYGFIAPHHKSITYYLEEHIKGLEVNVGYKTNGAKKWQQIYNYPFLGVGYYHSGLANNKVFGKANALFLYLKSDKQLFRNKALFYNKISFGISHISEKFDLHENHYNISIGSHFNAFIQGTLGIQYQIYPKVLLSAGMSFTHSSNGHLKSPNQGLNFITTSLGLNYDFNTINSDFQYETKKKETDYQFTVISSVGVKQVSHRVKGNFFTSSLVFDVDLLRFNKRRYGFGFDFFYDESTKKQHEFDKVVFSESDNYYRIAGHLSYVTVVGKTSFVIQPGIYLWNHYEVFGRISNRLGIRYRFSEHFLFNISVKAHWVAIADYLEWGIGYAW
jgi:hypothetical protein